MGRKDYSGRDHVGTRVLAVADGVLGSDVINKSQLDSAAAQAAPNLQDRWAGTVNLMTVANGGYIGISNLTATVARGISHSNGSFVPSKSGVYVITCTLACSTGIATGTCFLDLVHLYDGTNGRISRVVNVNQYFTLTASWGMDIYKTFYFAIGNNAGGSISVNGVMSIVRVSEV